MVWGHLGGLLIIPKQAGADARCDTRGLGAARQMLRSLATMASTSSFGGLFFSASLRGCHGWCSRLFKVSLASAHDENGAKGCLPVSTRLRASVRVTFAPVTIAGVSHRERSPFVPNGQIFG